MYIGTENKVKMDAARRALSLCNRLRPSPYKAKHNKRIMRNISLIRAGKPL